MTLNIYLVRDERGDEFGTPIFTDKDPEALQSDYSKSVRNLDAQLEALAPQSEGQAPLMVEKFLNLVSAKAQLKDTVVYHVGEFESTSGLFNIYPEKILCFRVQEVM